MREAIREIVDDLPAALITAAGIALVEAAVIAWMIVLATPIPEVMQ